MVGEKQTDVGMLGDLHPSDTHFVIKCDTDRDGGSVTVAASGQLISYGEMHELIDAVRSALSDPRVRSIEVDLSHVEETGPALSGVLSVLRTLMEGTDAELSIRTGPEAERWVPPVD